MWHTGLSIVATATVRRHWHFYSTKRSGTVQITEKVPLNLPYVSRYLWDQTNCLLRKSVCPGEVKSALLLCGWDHNLRWVSTQGKLNSYC